MEKTGTHLKLLHLTEEKCFPYLLDLPQLKPFLDKSSIILVGSVATGLCREDSDIDIAIVCDKAIFTEISKDTQWAKGIPTETKIDGVQFHYYATTFDGIKSKLQKLDDMYLYVYGYAKILQDPQNAFERFISKYKPDDIEIRKQRIEGKIDMLLRRTQALNYALGVKDLFGIIEICKELIALSLKVSALLDNVPFEPRKRLFQTSLQGKFGSQLKSNILRLFTDLGAIGQLETEANFKEFSFIKTLLEITKLILSEAKKQGFKVGLKKPDYRHREK